MRRRKTDAYKFDEIRIQLRSIDSLEKLDEYIVSVEGLFEDENDRKELYTYVEERRAELNGTKNLPSVVQKKDFVDAEFEVVDDEQTNGEEACEVEFNDTVGNAYKKYEDKLKRLVDRRKDILGKIDEAKDVLKDLKNELDLLNNSIADTAAGGHDNFIEQPTLFDIDEECA